MRFLDLIFPPLIDTDLNKLLICIDADSKKWVDVNGVQITETLL